MIVFFILTTTSATDWVSLPSQQPENMSKRTADEAAGTGTQPPIKKVHFEPHLMGPISTLEEMDIKVLQFQNKKLAQV